MYDLEEMYSEIENNEYQIEQLEEMYKHAKALVELDEDDFMLDIDFESIRNDIDKKIADLRENNENIEEQIEYIQYDDIGALKREYERSLI
jgi:hypothetical protein